jgi:hypothetical protein
MFDPESFMMCWRIGTGSDSRINLRKCEKEERKTGEIPRSDGIRVQSQRNRNNRDDN